MSVWVSVLISGLIGVIGIVSGIIGMALYMGRFEGSVITRLDGISDDVVDSKLDRTKIWEKLDTHGERIAGLERACDLNHYHKG